MKLKRGFKEFLIRITIFAVIAIVVPLIIKLIANLENLNLAFVYRGDYLDIFFAATVITFIALKRKELLNLKHYKNNVPETIIFAAFSAVFYYGVFYNRYVINASFLSAHIRSIIILTFLFYGIAILMLGLAVFNLRFFNKFFNSLIAALGIIIGYTSSVFVLNIHWRFFARLVTQISALLLKLTLNNVVVDFTRTDPLLTADKFSAIIGSPCSGITSLSMFIGLFLLILIIDYKKLVKNRTIPYFLIGFAGMFAVAVLRVYFLMLIGVKISPGFALNAFHNNAGWILFIIYLIGYWYIVYPRLFKR